MEENLNLINEFYLPKVEKDFLDNSSAVKILNDNKIDNHELLGIDKDKDAGDIQLTYKDEKEKQADGISFLEGLWEFVKDVPPSTYQSLKLAGVNGADVMVNMVPLIDRLFSLDPNYTTNQPLMDTMKNWTKHLDVVREEIKAKRDQNQIVSQWVSMIFQDLPYAIPLHKKFKNSGMPKWLAMPLAYGLGYALGFDEQRTSMFLNSKDMQALKSLINITENTPEDKLFDNVWQAVEGTAFMKLFPELWKGIKFAKRNIPKINKETISDVSQLAAASTVLATAATEARSVEKPINNKQMQKLINDAEAKNESILFYDAATMTESGPNDPINDYIYIKDKKALENSDVVFFDAATNTQMTYQKKGETDDNFIKLLSTSQRAKADSSPESIGLNSISKQTKK